MKIYTVGVQRGLLWLSYKKYKVIGHNTEMVGNFPRLILSCADGSYVIIPRLDKRRIKIYPDYQIVIASAKIAAQPEQTEPKKDGGS